MRIHRFGYWLCGLAVGWALSIGSWAQETESTEGQRLDMESHIGKLTGHARAGAPAYRRFCIGCHGPLGDGQGDDGQWLDPKPRNFTLATFRCRSTPTGTLPTDQDLFNTIGRGVENSNMPHWLPLTDQNRSDLVAYVKHFSPKWLTEKPGTPIQIPQEPEVTAERIKAGQALFQKLECWKCHGVEGRGNGPSADALTDDQNRPIKPYNFRDGTRFKCGSTDGDLYRIFMTGLDGTPMPSYADNVKPDEAWDLVFYLRTLQPMKTKAKQIAKQLGLKPINPLAATGGEPQEKAETASAQAAPAASPNASSQPAQGSSAPTESNPGAATAGEAAKATAGAGNPAPAQPAPKPGTTTASGTGETGAANPAPTQPAADPKPGTTTPGGGAETGSADSVPVQPAVSQPAGESKPSGAAAAISGAGSAVNPRADPRPTAPRSELSRTSATVHTAHRMPALSGPPRVELLNLAVADEAGRISVTMMLSGPVVPQLKRLDSPARVVVDLPKTVMATPQQRIAVGKDGAKGVRLGMDAQVPPTTRVVVDLTRPLAYQIVAGGDNTWILELYPEHK